MEIYIVFLFGVALLILVNSYKIESSRLAAYLIMTAGFAFLSVYIADHTDKILQMPRLSSSIKFVEYLSSSIWHYLAPCFFLMLGISNLPVNNRIYRCKNIASFILLIPVILMYIAYPINKGFFPNVKIMSSWASVYIVLGVILLFSSYRNHHLDDYAKKQKLIFCIIFIPTMLFSLVVNHLDNFFPQLIGAWRYGIIVLIIESCLLIYITIKFGFAGLRLKLEQQQTDQRVTSVTASINSLVHALKNQILLEKYELEYLIGDLDSLNDLKSLPIANRLRGIQAKNEHLIEFIKDINKKINNKPIIKERCRLFALVNEAEKLLKTTEEKEKYIFMKELLGNDIEIYCDRHQLTEVLINIYLNAAESMVNGGEILIKCFHDSKNIYIIVKDNGVGIPKENIHKITDPFFSTKGGKNYGIGLSYCYNIVKQHKGILFFESKQDIGTSVRIIFPVKYLSQAREERRWKLLKLL